MRNQNTISNIISQLSESQDREARRKGAMNESMGTRLQGHKIRRMLESDAIKPLETNTEVAPINQNEVTVGRDMPTKIYQCSVCKAFFSNGQGDLTVCPVCGTANTIQVVGDVVPTGDPAVAQVNADAQADLNEALSLLNHGKTKKFAESYGSRTRLNKRGGLELSYTKGRHSVVVESVMNLRQKSAYEMSVKLIESASKLNQSPSKLQEFTESKRRGYKVAHTGMRIRTEMMSLAHDSARILERMGCKYDYKKFIEQMESRASKRSCQLSEDVEQYISDESYEYKAPSEMSEYEYSEAAKKVISENGLEVISAETTFDGDAAQVKIRVQDNDETVLDMKDVAEVLASEYEAPVVVLAQEVPGDSSMTDVTLVVNEDRYSSSEGSNDEAPQSESSEGSATEAEENFEESIARHNKKVVESIMSDKCPDCGKLPCQCKKSDKNKDHHTFDYNESIMVDEQLKYFILSLESPDEDPSVLAYDGSLVSLSDSQAEDTAAIFNDVESAQKFVEDNGLIGTAKVVSGSVVDENEEVVEADDNDETEDLTVNESFSRTISKGRKARSRKNSK